MATDDRSARRFTFPDGSSIVITPFRPEADTNQQLQIAGIELTPEQKNQLRQAFSEAIANTLTPEQYQQWEQYVSDLLYTTDRTKSG